MRLLPLLEDKRKFGAIWYEFLRQSPKIIAFGVRRFSSSWKIKANFADGELELALPKAVVSARHSIKA